LQREMWQAIRGMT